VGGVGAVSSPDNGTRSPRKIAAPAPPATVEVAYGGGLFSVVVDARQAADSPAVGTAIAAKLPSAGVVRRGRAQVTVRYDAAATARRVVAAATGGDGRVGAVSEPVASRIAVPVIAQKLRNNCEAAALSMLLSHAGKPTDQLRVQQLLPRSGTLDPVNGPSGKIWGDPDRGFVGRPDGGGIAGGFGVYPGPVRATAARLKVSLADVSGSSFARIKRLLLAGRPVMAWVGLSSSTYGSWLSPSGRAIKVNFGEHTVVLTGLHDDGSVRVANPLQGTAERWSAAQFVAMWNLLGRRALAA